MKITNSPSNSAVDSLTAAQPDINATVSASAGTGKTWLLGTMSEDKIQANRRIKLAFVMFVVSIGWVALLLISLIMLGGDFWEKLRSLFIHGAYAVIPAKTSTHDPSQ